MKKTTLKPLTVNIDSVPAVEISPDAAVAQQATARLPSAGQTFESTSKIASATSLISEELVPVKPINRRVFNRNPDSFFANTEQIAFCTARVVPGIDFSNDPLRAGHIHSYLDTQATLFYDSQTEVERMHTLGGLRFKLSQLTVPAIRERMLSPVLNVSADMAAKVAVGLGMEVPKAMPNALVKSVTFEVVKSSILSLTAFPGDGGIPTRKVAFLVADGVHRASVMTIKAALTAASAVTCIIGPHLGPVKTAGAKSVEATETFENSPPVLSDALVLPDGDDRMARLAKYGQMREFVTNQHRHRKTMLVQDAFKARPDQAGTVTILPSGQSDLGILLASVDATGDSAAAFIAAAGQHRHSPRETGMPRI